MCEAPCTKYVVRTTKAIINIAKNILYSIQLNTYWVKEQGHIIGRMSRKCVMSGKFPISYRKTSCQP